MGGMMERVLGVAIGISVVCLLLSIIASHVQEVWAAFSARRAASLEAALHSMLGNEVANEFFKHPLIQTISFSVPRTRWRRKAPVESRPTYISSVLFSRVLFATLTEYHSLHGVSLPEVIRRMPPSDLKKRLQAIVVGTANDEQACALAIEQWYDGTMDRINGFYKRNTQWTLLTLGVILAVLCNANLFTITEKLWTSDDARVALNATAQMYNCKDGASCADKNYEDAQRRMASDLANYLPLGYHRVGDYWTGLQSQWKRPSPRWRIALPILGAWIYQLAGWGLTGVAVSLGAPFWFDAVNKLINLRLAGAKPPRTIPPFSGILAPPDAAVVNAPQTTPPAMNVTAPKATPDPSAPDPAPDASPNAGPSGG
jgi:hypothetical protein